MKKILSLCLLLLSGVTYAEVKFIHVPDPQNIRWQMAADGTVFFRNITLFQAGVLSGPTCCYSYKLDTSSQGGMLMWSTLLSYMNSKTPVDLGFEEGNAVPADQYKLKFVGEH